MSFPIVYVTSVSQSWRKIRAEARKEALRLGSGSCELILQPPRLSHLAEKKWADGLLEASKSRPLVVAAQAEVALLRLLRLTKGQKRLRVIVLSEKCEPMELRVAANEGEFIDPWPEGFFSGRAEELF